MRFLYFAFAFSPKAKGNANATKIVLHILHLGCPSCSSKCGVLFKHYELFFPHNMIIMTVINKIEVLPRP